MMMGGHLIQLVDFLDVLGDETHDGFIGIIQHMTPAVDEMNGNGELFFVREQHDVRIGGIDIRADISGHYTNGLVMNHAVQVLINIG